MICLTHEFPGRPHVFNIDY